MLWLCCISRQLETTAKTGRHCIALPQTAHVWKIDTQDAFAERLVCHCDHQRSEHSRKPAAALRTRRPELRRAGRAPARPSVAPRSSRCAAARCPSRPDRPGLPWGSQALGASLAPPWAHGRRGAGLFPGSWQLLSSRHVRRAAMCLLRKSGHSPHPLSSRISCLF